MAEPIPANEVGQTPATVNGAPAAEEMYPYPEILADWQWVFDEMGTARFLPYLGQYIAVCDRKVLGSGPDEQQLRAAVAAEHHVPWDRLITTFIDDRE